MSSLLDFSPPLSTIPFSHSLSFSSLCHFPPLVPSFTSCPSLPLHDSYLSFPLLLIPSISSLLHSTPFTSVLYFTPLPHFLPSPDLLHFPLLLPSFTSLSYFPPSLPSLTSLLHFLGKAGRQSLQKVMGCPVVFQAKPYSWMPGGGMAIEVAVTGSDKV